MDEASFQFARPHLETSQSGSTVGMSCWPVTWKWARFTDHVMWNTWRSDTSTCRSTVPLWSFLHFLCPHAARRVEACHTSSELHSKNWFLVIVVWSRSSTDCVEMKQEVITPAQVVWWASFPHYSSSYWFVFTCCCVQVANYGVGGQYEPHFDFGRVNNFLFTEVTVEHVSCDEHLGSTTFDQVKEMIHNHVKIFM